MSVPTAYVNRSELTQRVESAISALDPQEVARAVYSIGEDSTDEPAIFFRVVLTDPASKEERLWDVTTRVESTLVKSIRPMEHWGLTPYFSYRSLSEQSRRNDPEWS